MSPFLLLTLVAVFVSVALVSASAAYVVLARHAPERKRLRDLAAPKTASVLVDSTPLTEKPNRTVQRLATIVPKSPREMTRLRRRLVLAGYPSLTAALVYSLAEVVTPAVLGVLPLLIMGPRGGWIIALFAALVGYLIPGVFLARQIEKRKKIIRNGLPDALDLFIVCLEAGCSLDQAILKASEELQIAYPALGEELRLITTETRAGKPRLEAFKNFEGRTKVDEVRALVAMLVQADRFGTSVALALRTFADVCRTKRRQRAEEQAAKVGVKLVFPLVLFLFPAFYVVTLGPAVIQFIRVFFAQVVQQAR